MNQGLSGIVSTLLKRAMKESGKRREELAREMTATTGCKISKASLDTWTAGSKVNWRFPFEYAPAFELATGSKCLSEFLAHCSNGQVIFGADIELLGVVKIQQQIEALEKQKKTLLKMLNKET